MREDATPDNVVPENVLRENLMRENAMRENILPETTRPEAESDIPETASAIAASVSIECVTKVFNEGRPNEVEALQHIDLTVEPGEFVTLIGPSGCGKSTLLRMIASLTPPSDGDITVNGKSAEQARLDRDYGMAFQKAGLFDWRTVSKNIELPLELMGWAPKDRKARAKTMLELVQLGDFGDHHPAELSGGMQQRIAIARALSFEPSLLLMDEPFGALDEMTREHVQDELLRLWRETETTVVFVTHSVPEAVYLSTRVLVMSPRPGRIASMIDIDLEERRAETRDDPRFHLAVSEVRKALRSVDA